MPVGPRRTKGTEARARETDRTGRQYGHCPQSQGVSSYEAATSRDAPRWPKPDAGADRVADAGGKGRAVATDALVAIRRPRGGPRGANPIAPSTHMRDRKRGVAVAPGVVSASLLSPDALAGVSRKSSKQLILISRESRAAEVTRCRASRLTRWRCAPWRFAGLAPSCGQRPAFVLARVWLAGGARA